MPKRRRQYRVKPGHADMITVSLVADDRIVRGAIEDISACGLKLSFKNPEPPRLRLRDVVHLRLSSPYLAEPLTIPSLVTYRAEADQGVTHGFEFIDWLGLLSSVPEELRAVFNRRRDQRVAPDPREPVAIRIRIPGTVLEATVDAQEISASGLSFVAGAELERALDDVDLVSLSLRLPGAGEDLAFTGKVLARSLTRDGIRHGVYLVEDGSEVFERGVAALAAYVAGRRREALGFPAAPAALEVSSGSWPSWRVR